MTDNVMNVLNKWSEDRHRRYCGTTDDVYDSDGNLHESSLYDRSLYDSLAEQQQAAEWDDGDNRFGQDMFHDPFHIATSQISDTAHKTENQSPQPREATTMSAISVSGSFDFVKSYDHASFENAHYASTQCELWEWIRDFDPPSDQGFMFSDTHEMNRIKTAMFEHNDSVAGGHSGSSYAYVMRLMQYIATHGFAQFKNDYLRDR